MEKWMSGLKKYGEAALKAVFLSIFLVASFWHNSADANIGRSLRVAINTIVAIVWSSQEKETEAKPNAYDRNNMDSFGEGRMSVAIYNGTMVVGAPKQDYDRSGLNSVTDFGAAYVFTRLGNSWALQQKLIPMSGNPRTDTTTNFGMSVSIYGDTIVIGAMNDDYDASGGTSMSNSGAAYVFTRNGQVWTQQQKLVGGGTGGRVAGDLFGQSVSIYGDNIAVGAPGQDTDAAGGTSIAGAGAVFVYTRSGTTWTQQQKVIPAAGTNTRVASDNLGYHVAISGNDMIVGAYTHDYDAAGATSVSGAGAAYIFTRSGTTWAQQQKIVAGGGSSRVASDWFGLVVAISGNTVAVAAPQQDYDAAGANSLQEAGAVFVFTRSGTVWGQQQRVVATGTNARTSYSYFGRSIGLAGDTLYVGAPEHDYDDTGTTDTYMAGAGFIFTRSGTTWSVQQKIVASGTNARIDGDTFGFSGNIDPLTGDVGVSAPIQSYDAVGANSMNSTGAAFIFTRTGTTWTQQGRVVGQLTGRGPNEYYGYSVAMSGQTMVVGAYGHTADQYGAGIVGNGGAAYVYTQSGAAWSLQQKIVPTGLNSRTQGSKFGFSVAIDGNTIVVGASDDSFDENGANSVGSAGSAFIFTRNGTTWTQQQKIVATGASNRNSFDAFGKSVSISGDTVVVGAIGQDYDNGASGSLSSAGAAYVFTRTGTTWTQQQKLIGTGVGNSRMANDEFGSATAISANTILIGASQHSYDASGGSSLAQAGAVFIFTRTGVTWQLEQKLAGVGVNGRMSSDSFGSSVSISTHTAVIGALGQDYDESGANSIAAGAVYVFTRSAGVWSIQQKLVASGSNGRVLGDKFGISVAVDGDNLIVGASEQDYDMSGANSVDKVGAAYVFTRSGTTWTQQQKVVVSGTNERVAQDELARSVTISGNNLAMGAASQDYDSAGATSIINSGAVYLFSK